MNNLKPDTCVVAFAPISANTCEKMNSPTISKTLWKDGSTGDILVKPSINARKFDLNTFEEMSGVKLTTDEQTRITN